MILLLLVGKEQHLHSLKTFLAWVKRDSALALITQPRRVPSMYHHMIMKMMSSSNHRLL